MLYYLVIVLDHDYLAALRQQAFTHYYNLYVYVFIIFKVD